VTDIDGPPGPQAESATYYGGPLDGQQASRLRGAHPHPRHRDESGEAAPTRSRRPAYTHREERHGWQTRHVYVHASVLEVWDVAEEARQAAVRAEAWRDAVKHRMDRQRKFTNRRFRKEGA
jgi:hypothetical protein